jgi:Domain of unknown function (DUF4145)
MKLALVAQKTLHVNCHRCKSHTQHEILRSQSEIGSNEHIDWYRLELQIFRCKRCLNICFRQSAWNSGDTQFDCLPEEHGAAYPVRSGRVASVDEWELPDRVRTLYKETLNGFNAMAMTLSATGLRSVVEAACVDQGCTDATLEMKIQALVTKGVFLKRDAEYLHQHRFLGNEAVAGMDSPPKEEFEIALQILEHLLTTLYVLPHLELRLRRLRVGPGPKGVRPPVSIQR